ncbi:MAG: hypothetical protein NZ898_04235 [Myxococcota bacterium]|nr:hypothetical protein [Myxococcota bacterium]
MHRLRVLVVLVSACSARPTVARAWTDASVTEASAHLDIEADGSARVALALVVQVRAGWLERLEIGGVCEGVQLEREKSSWAWGSNGRKFEPRAEVRGDRLVVRFERARAPRRGRLELGVAMRCPSLHADGSAEEPQRLRWSLPAWESDLARAAVTVRAPPGARLLDPEPTVRLARWELRDATYWRLERSQLPRTLPWVVGLELRRPASEQEALVEPLEVEAQQPVVGRWRAPERPGLLLAVIVSSIVSWCGRAGVLRAGARRGRRLQPLVPGTHGLAALLALGLGTVGLVVPLEGALLGLVLCAIAAMAVVRPAGDDPTLRPAAWRPADGRERVDAVRANRRRCWFGAHVLDATAPSGAVLWLGSLGAMLAASWLEGDAVATIERVALAMAALVAAWGCRGHLAGRSALETLGALLARSGRLAVVGTPVVLVCADGRLLDARIRFVDPDRSRGLLRLDLALDRGRAALVALTRADGEADRMFPQLWPGARRHRWGSRCAHVLNDPRRLGAALGAALAWLDAAMPATQPAGTASRQKAA